MKNTLLFLAVFSMTLCSYAQQHRKIFDQCKSLKIYSVKKGDTVIVQCDTVLLLNKKYAGALKNINANSNDLISLLYNRIDEQTNEYNHLRLLYDSLQNHSLNYINRTDGQLKVLKDSVQQSIMYIHSAQKGLEEIKDDIKKGMKKSKVTTGLLWGSCGLAAGVLIGTLLGFLH